MPILSFSHFCVSFMDLFRFYVDLNSSKSSIIIHLVWYFYLGISHCCCQSGAHYHKSLSRRAFIILSQSLAPLITQYTSNIYFRVKPEDDDNDDTYYYEVYVCLLQKNISFSNCIKTRFDMCSKMFQNPFDKQLMWCTCNVQQITGSICNLNPRELQKWPLPQKG